MKIFEALKYIDKTLPTAIFIRHGKKLVTQASEADEAVLLSDKGRLNALLTVFNYNI